MNALTFLKVALTVSLLSLPARAESLPVVPYDVPTGSLAPKLIGTKWSWNGKETITFLKDGKIQWKNDPHLWTWRVLSDGYGYVEGLNTHKQLRFTIVFDEETKTGKIEQDRVTRKTQKVN